MITASLVKSLREKTGAGMMDCKKALAEVNGDFEEAITWLRKKGISSAAKKAERVAAEGAVAVEVQDNIGAIIEFNAETDFVARNAKFQGLVHSIVKVAIKTNDIDTLKNADMGNGKSVQDEILENIATIGENLTLSRMELSKVDKGVIGSYVHNSVAENMGKIAVLVALESDGDKTKLRELGKHLAMHIVATKPHSIDVESLDPALVQKEREIFISQSKASGKPDNIIEKMVEGRVRKFFEETVLLEQTFVIDGQTKIADVIGNVAKEIGTPIKLKSFTRYELGENIVPSNSE